MARNAVSARFCIRVYRYLMRNFQKLDFPALVNESGLVVPGLQGRVGLLVLAHPAGAAVGLQGLTPRLTSPSAPEGPSALQGCRRSEVLWHPPERDRSLQVEQSRRWSLLASSCRWCGRRAGRRNCRPGSIKVQVADPRLSPKGSTGVGTLTIKVATQRRHRTARRQQATVTASAPVARNLRVLIVAGIPGGFCGARRSCGAVGASRSRPW